MNPNFPDGFFKPLKWSKRLRQNPLVIWWEKHGRLMCIIMSAFMMGTILLPELLKALGLW